MATLYVENIPDDLYKALKEQALAKRTSLASEVISLLSRHVHTQEQLDQRKRFLQKALKMTAAESLTKGPFPSSEEMLRKDRAR